MKLHELFRILASQIKLEILSLLLENDLCVCQICAIVGTSQPNISQHLNTLRHLGVVDIRKDGTFIYYSLDKRFLKQYPFLKAVLQYAKKDYQMSVKTCGAK